MRVEWWIVFATLAGPILAVQAQKWVERITESRRRQNQLFVALMANRGTRMHEDFVRALNLIDLEFRPGLLLNRPKKRAVIEAWRSLHDEFSHGTLADEAARAAWNLRVEDRLVDLLAAMAAALGYSFTKELLRRGWYHPQGLAERENAQLEILQGIRNLLSGRTALPMAVTQFPGDPAVAQAQADLAKKAAAAYDEKDGALKIKQV